LQISARWHVPVMLRMTTRVCHSKTLVEPHPPAKPRREAHFDRNIPGRVMIPAHARPAHHRLRRKLAEMAAWNESCELNRVFEGNSRVGMITSGVVFMHVHEAVPDATVLKLGFTHPLPLERIRRFAETVEQCWVIEEGDPYLFEQIRAAGIAVQQKPEMYRFGELNVSRARRILAGDVSPEPAPLPGKPPALCAACPHRVAFAALKKLDCIVAGDIGCYTLGALPPLEAMDSQLCMGASIGMGLGLRHVLPESEARRVVSVIGDSTFMHSGITGLIEMVYNPPATGHVVLIFDNGTTAMTGLQEHPGTGRALGGEPAGQVVPEDLARAIGVRNVIVVDPVAEMERLEHSLRDALGGNELTVIVVRRRCLLAAAKESKRERRAKAEDQEGQAAGETERENEASAASERPTPPSAILNIVIAGLGGQGVLTASDILAEAAVLAGFDVKKADVHGMSQRGGSVASDVRFGGTVLSPMVPPGEADVLLVLAEDQVENNRPRLREDGVLIAPDAVDPSRLPNRRSANVALLGVLSRRLDIDLATWREAIRRHMKPELYDVNCRAFEFGRESAAE
jgi:indolepyruvate ferredoxin oxidoreductase, alpha subunit